MIIDAVSDLHGFYPQLKGGDLLLLCGDYTASDTLKQWAEFFGWLKNQDYRKKILIAGNHDNFLENAFPKTAEEYEKYQEIREFLDLNEKEFPDFEYLCDSGTEFEGLKIWGSPWSVLFNGVHRNCKAFMVSESKMINKFDMIPSDTDILMTHTPPYLILDENSRRCPCGSLQLLYQLETRVFPSFHFFGHIHENHGGTSMICGTPSWERKTEFYNVSYVDENYEPMGTVIRVSI